MKFILGLLGAVLGAVVGQTVGAVIGLALGLLAAFALEQRAASGRAVDDFDTQDTVQTRLIRLEDEVAALRSQVAQLAAGDAPAVAAPAPAKPVAMRAAPAPVVSAAAATTMASRVEPAPDDFVDTHPIAPTAEEAQAFASVAADPPIPAAPHRAPIRPPAASPQLPAWVSRLVFGGNTIVKVGVLILFLGLAFLLRYASERVSLPVEFRYIGVTLLGAVLLGIGWRLRGRRAAAGGPEYGLVLQGAGIGVFYLTTLAALKFNQLLPPELAFAFLFAVSVLSAVLAVSQNAPWLAYVAAAEGFAAPVLVSTGGGNHVALFSYLAILDVGIFLMAWFKAWRPLNLIGFVGTFALAGAWARKHYVDALYPSTQGFLLLFFVLFTMVGVLFARRALAQAHASGARDSLPQRAAQALSDVGRVDSSLVFGVPLASFGLQYAMVRNDAWGPAFAALGFAAFYLLLGGALIRGGHRRYSLLGEAYVIVSVIFGTLAIPLALEGQWTGATWAVEAAGMYWLGMRQQRTYARGFALLVLWVAAVRVWSTLDFSPAANMPLFVGSPWGLLMVAISAFAISAVHWRAPRDTRANWEAAAGPGPLWIALASLAAMAWLLLAPTGACIATSLLGLAALWGGLRAGHPAPVTAWGALQLAAGLAFLAYGPELGDPGAPGLTLWAPLVLTLVAMLSGDAIQRGARQPSAPSFLRSPALQWGVVTWSLVWWAATVLPDLLRHLQQTQRDWTLLWPAVLVGWVTLSSVLATVIARWRAWPILGQLTCATLPAWAVVAWLAVGLPGRAPHTHLGWAVWPLALLWHALLLRAQERWCSSTSLTPLHVGGFWLFLLLAAREAQWWTEGLGAAGSAWPVLGWALVPALVLALVARPGLRLRWPLKAFHDAYLLIACAPLALYLLLWLWVSNTGSGDAAPLPYVPLLNPLELGQGLVLIALLLWRQALPASAQTWTPRPVLLAGLGVTAFALYTGMVLRACHHIADVAWNAHALFGSTLTQAALSVAWSIVGVALMTLGHRRVLRVVWLVGAGLLGVVVLKLFFVELADQGGLYRIVSFIVVGLLLLLVGYVAPVPPSTQRFDDEEAPDAA